MAAGSSPFVNSRITAWYLKRSPLFEPVAHETVEFLASRLRTTEYAKKDLVFTPGRELSNTYFLLRGSVKVSRVEPSDGKELILYLVKPGEPFGALPFTGGIEDKRIAVAHQKSLVGVFGKRAWEKVLASDRELYRSVTRVAGERLLQLQGRMTEIAYRDVHCRVARLLLRLSREYPLKRECGVQIRLPFTQQDISNFIAATREITSLTINDFKRNGWIAMHNHRICIHKPRALRRIAD